MAKHPSNTSDEPSSDSRPGADKKPVHQDQTGADSRGQLDSREQLIVELREAVRARDDFLAVVAHELRNPLATIKASAEMLSGKVVRDDPAVLARSAPTRPGRRWCRGGMALNRCVAIRAPASRPATACAAFAPECPRLTTTTSAVRAATVARAPVSSPPLTLPTDHPPETTAVAHHLTQP